MSSYPGYQNFTVDNFIVEAVNSSGTISTSVTYQTPTNYPTSYSGSNVLNCTANKNYENGIFTSSISCDGTLSVYQYVSGRYLISGSSTANVNMAIHAYLIY